MLRRKRKLNIKITLTLSDRHTLAILAVRQAYDIFQYRLKVDRNKGNISTEEYIQKRTWFLLLVTEFHSRSNPNLVTTDADVTQLENEAKHIYDLSKFQILTSVTELITVLPLSTKN